MLHHPGKDISLTGSVVNLRPFCNDRPKLGAQDKTTCNPPKNASSSWRRYPSYGQRSQFALFLTTDRNSVCGAKRLSTPEKCFIILVKISLLPAAKSICPFFNNRHGVFGCFGVFFFGAHRVVTLKFRGFFRENALFFRPRKKPRTMK